MKNIDEDWCIQEASGLFPKYAPNTATTDSEIEDIYIKLGNQIKETNEDLINYTARSF